MLTEVHNNDEAALTPLRQFLKFMLDDATLQPSEPLKDVMKHLCMIVHPAETLPTDLKKAVQCINERAKSEEHQDNGLSAVFVGIASGKLLVKQANVYADKATKDLEFLEEATENFQGVSELSQAVVSQGLIDLSLVPEILQKGVKAMDTATDSRSSSEAVKSFSEKCKSTVFHLIPNIGKLFVKDLLVPWMVDAVNTLKDTDMTKSLKPLDAINLEMLDFVLGKKVLEKSAVNLTCAVKLYRVLQSLVGCFGETIQDVDIVKVVSLIKNMSNFLNTWNGPLEKIDADAASTGFSLLDLVKGPSAGRACKDAETYIVKVGKFMAKALI